MVNESHEPTDDEDAVVRLLAEERRANPYLIREETGLAKQNVNEALKQLQAAGWVEKRTRGLYDFVADPRED